MNKNQVASQETIKNILQISRWKFADKGYDKTSLNEIVQELGLTRGAFYHHFSNKEELFFAVFSEVQEDLGNYVGEVADREESLWQQLELGCIAFVKYAIRPDVHRILLIDGPAVLPWSKWKQLDRENSQDLLNEIIEILQKSGEFKSVNPNYASNLISGALNELVLFLTHEEKVDVDEIIPVIKILLGGFRNHG